MKCVKRYSEVSSNEMLMCTGCHSGITVNNEVHDTRSKGSKEQEEQTKYIHLNELAIGFWNSFCK